jgi:hypothetical protein
MMAYNRSASLNVPPQGLARLGSHGCAEPTGARQLGRPTE